MIAGTALTIGHDCPFGVVPETGTLPVLIKLLPDLKVNQ
jgi:hypothetical protein